MGEATAIEWTDATWTPIRARNKVTGKVGWHCEHASPGCQHCYSESFNEKRLGTGLPFKPSHRGDVEHFLDETMLLAPLRWRRPRRIFVCSMTDLFGDWVKDVWIDRVFAVAALAPQHTLQVLTKRSARMRAYMSDPRVHERVWAAADALRDATDLGDGTAYDWPIRNVWLGVSAEDQRRADERVPDLLATPAAIRFVSAEPLLGPIDFLAIKWPNTGGHRVDVLRRGYWTKAGAHPLSGASASPGEPKGSFTNHSDIPGRLDWIVVGGESGAGARPMHPAWPREIRDACAAAGVAYLFKQWGAYQHGSTMGRAPSRDRIVFNDGRMLADCTMPSCKVEDREHGWQGRDPEMMARVGKKAAGRLLDGVEHNGMPRTPP